MGSLMLDMVAYDAFTQALNNPLLSRDIYNHPDTFGPKGREKYIDRISNVQELADYVLKSDDNDESTFCSLSVPG